MWNEHSRSAKKGFVAVLVIALLSLLWLNACGRQNSLVEESGDEAGTGQNGVSSSSKAGESGTGEINSSGHHPLVRKRMAKVETPSAQSAATSLPASVQSNVSIQTPAPVTTSTSSPVPSQTPMPVPTATPIPAPIPTPTPVVLTIDTPMINSHFIHSFIVSGSCSSGLLVTASVVEGGSSTSIVCPVSNIYSVELTPEGSDGARTIAVTSSNSSQNSITRSVSIIKDSTPPGVNFSLPSVASMNQSGSSSLVVTFSDANGVSVVSSSHIFLITTGTVSCTSAITGTGVIDSPFIVTISDCVGNGTVGVSAAPQAATDIVGNSSAGSSSITVVQIDNTAPAVSLKTPLSGAIFYSANVTVSALTGNCESGLTVVLEGDVATGQSTSCVSDSFSFSSWSLSQGLGTKSVSVSQMDAAGNKTLSTAVNYTLAPAGWSQEAYVKAVNSESYDYFGDSVALSGDLLAVGASFEDSNQTTITNGQTVSDNNAALNSGVVYFYRRTNKNWSPEAYVKASNAQTNDYFGRGFSLSGDTLAVGAEFEDSSQTTITNGTLSSANDSSTNSGAIYVYRRSAHGIAQQAYVKASNAQANDNFGRSVALSGNTLAVGAYGEDSNQTTITNGSVASTDNSATDSGAVYVYRRNVSAWAQEAFIKAPNAGSGDWFGRSVSLSGDTLAVGARSEDSNQTTITNGTGASANESATNAGAVYVFRRTGNTWLHEAYVKASNAEGGDLFGGSVSLSGDSLAVGSVNEDSNQTIITNSSNASADNSATNSGAVYIYRRNGNSWAQEAFVKASNTEGADLFGSSLALSGETLAIGATGEDSSQTIITNASSSALDNLASSSGAVYVYRRMGSGWAQESYVKASNGEAGDTFGASIALSGDTLTVGASCEDSRQTTITNASTASADNTATDPGAVYVFRNPSRMFDPDVWVSARTSHSVTFSWGSSVGNAVAIKVAPAVLAGAGSSAVTCEDPASVLLPAGTTSYTYPGLSVGTKYGFRFCAWDGSTTSAGSSLWETTD